VVVNENGVVLVAVVVEVENEVLFGFLYQVLQWDQLLLYQQWERTERRRPPFLAPPKLRRPWLLYSQWTMLML
jgi:hypothetical protein